MPGEMGEGIPTPVQQPVPVEEQQGDGVVGDATQPDVDKKEAKEVKEINVKYLHPQAISPEQLLNLNAELLSLHEKPTENEDSEQEVEESESSENVQNPEDDQKKKLSLLLMAYGIPEDGVGQILEGKGSGEYPQDAYMLLELLKYVKEAKDKFPEIEVDTIIGDISDLILPKIKAELQINDQDVVDVSDEDSAESDPKNKKLKEFLARLKEDFPDLVVKIAEGTTVAEFINYLITGQESYLSRSSHELQKRGVAMVDQKDIEQLVGWNPQIAFDIIENVASSMSSDMRVAEKIKWFKSEQHTSNIPEEFAKKQPDGTLLFDKEKYTSWLITQFIKCCQESNTESLNLIKEGLYKNGIKKTKRMKNGTLEEKEHSTMNDFVENAHISSEIISVLINAIKEKKT